MSESHNEKIPPLAYLNDDFLKSSEARVLRLLSEYIEPRARLRRFNVRDVFIDFLCGHTKRVNVD